MIRVLRLVTSILTSIPLALMLYALLLFLGLISLVWNVVAMLIYPVMPARRRARWGARPSPLPTACSGGWPR
jgi:hypothetical protein